MIARDDIMTKQTVSNNRTDAKAKKKPAKVGTKQKSSSTTSSLPLVDDDVIAKTKKRCASSPRPAVVPEGWPVSSHYLTYPAPSRNNDRATNGTDDDIITTDDGPSSSSSSNKNYLTPGNLLRQSCNGSDVYLRKRAVQSVGASMYPIADNNNNSKGGPTRFLIVFPGRLSLKAPPPPPSSSSNYDENGARRGEEERLDNVDDAKKNPFFAPAHPPHLLGKLVTTTTTTSSLANDDDGGRTTTAAAELRIPLPFSRDAMNNDGQSQSQTMVLSGRAIPLSGKYMALSFKRTGGSKDSPSAPSGGGGNSKGGNNKRRGTGSIICKDVFRSVIVLGESKIVDGDGNPLTQAPSSSANAEEGEDGNRLRMLHYGGSDRTLDGGGKCYDGINGGRKGNNGGIPVTTKSVPTKDSVSSTESNDKDSDPSDDVDAEDDNGDSSDTDEFLPIISAKRRKTTGGSKKRGSADGASSHKADEDVTLARKRTPRRSVDTSKISYVDKSSSDEDLDSSDSDEGDSDDSNAYKPTRSKMSEKLAVKRSASTTSATKLSKTPNSIPKAGCKMKKSAPVLSVDSSDEENNAKEQIKQSGKRQSTKSTASFGGSSKTVRRHGSGAAKKVNFSPPNDIINVDSDEDETEKDELLNAISDDARKRLSTLSTNQSPLKSSPISRGRRKDKTSPAKRPSTTTDNDLFLDDDPFSFL